MKKGQILEGKIREVVFPNKGIAEVENENKPVIVKNSLAGQKVRFSINKIRKGKCEGRLLEVLEKSPVEIEPACPHFGACGGCTYQNLPYEEQLSMKKQQVKALMDGAVQGEYIFEGIKGSPKIFAYRNKMEFSFGDEIKDGPLALGLHKRGSFYDIVNVPDCQIVCGDFGKILTCVLEYCREHKMSFYHRMAHEGYLRHLLVRRGEKTGEILIDLVTSSQEQHDLKGFAECILALPLEGKVAGILHTYNDSLADVVQDDRTEILYGQDFFYEELLGLKFKITPFSFFQTNSLGAEVLYDLARSYVGEMKDKVIFDLYSGTGTIAQMLASVAKKVVGIEIVEEAVEAAKQNAEMNRLANCEFLAGDVLKAIDLVRETPDIIVLDPPRDGINPKALRKIAAHIRAKKMIYISCKPTSLARDLVEFQEYGYQVGRVCCVDMFPGTVHVETVCLLSKLHADQHIEVELQMDELDLTAAESKATYEEIKDYVLEHTGLKVSNLYIAQVKQKCGIIERANYNLPKSENSRQPKCPPEKEMAIREALGHFRMI
ncbi:MAG: 23S rRNA (uracil(1939)-C(5))-methyltransferase RlmD [Lachnospiraceae bacterium]|nr:23S rRNA (uracil(1939)-C(5))-methyltransferase RlmD [Lachnospiraceae bacterium]